MRRYLLAAIAAASPLLTSCAMGAHGARYELSLQRVERPADATAQYGAQRVDRIADAAGRQFRFSDDVVEVEWTVTSERIGLRLRNKSDHSIRVLWDNAAYVSPDGVSHRVMHTGVPYASRNEPQPPSVVVRGGEIRDEIVPTDYVFLATAVNWETRPFLQLVGGNPEKQSEALVGRTVRVLLPLEIRGVQNDYLFTFGIDRVCFWPPRYDALGRMFVPEPKNQKCVPAVAADKA
jgi:hypothetical protein